MRKKLLKLLRNIESKGEYLVKYYEYNESHDGKYSIEEYVTFPNYKVIEDAFNEKYPVYDGKWIVLTSDGLIKTELKRMERDGLIMIGLQDSIRQCSATENGGPDFDNVRSKTESIILTTMGKSSRMYVLHKIIENPVTTTIAIVSLVISIISLLK